MVGHGLCDRCGNSISFKDYNPEVNLIDGRIVCNICLNSTSVPSNEFITSNKEKETVDIISLILDRSSSMGSVKDSAISAVNEFVKTQQDIPGKALFYGAQFNHEYELTSDLNDIKNFVPLTKNTYVPAGCTALYDAIGRTILDLENKLNTSNIKVNKVIVAIQTDGDENSSLEFKNPELVSALIERKQTDGWQFIMLGSSWNTYTTANALHIPKEHVMQYTQTNAGTQRAFLCSSSAVGQYRSGLTKGITLPQTMEDKSVEEHSDYFIDFNSKSIFSSIDPNRFPPPKKKK